MKPDPELARAARRAVALSAQVCRSVQKQLERLRAITKDDRSPVTVADFASQAIVSAVLRERLGEDFGGGGLVAEEDATFLRKSDSAAYREATLSVVRQVLPNTGEERMLELVDCGAGEPAGARFWTLDPIDGTKGFLRGQQYAIALALVEDAKPVLGVLGCPNLSRDVGTSPDNADSVGSLYVAAEDADVMEYDCLPDTEEPGRALPRLDGVTDRPLLACASLEKGHSSVSDTDRVLAEIGGDREVLRMDGSAKYAVVARGQADMYLRLPARKDYVERIWDHAAGTAVATGAGCVVSDILGRSLDFSHGRGLEKNKGIVVARPGAHERVIAAIAELGIGAG